MEAFPPLPDWLQMEHQVATILTAQEQHGWYFDERAAWELASALRTELENIDSLLRKRYPLVPGQRFTPKRDNKSKGYIAGAEFTRLKEFNPTSRDHIAWILKTHSGWIPTALTATGKPIVDETSLKDIGTDLALSFLRMLEITKMLGMLSEGKNAWLKLVTRSKRIHHHCSVATNTGRCAHRNPNLAQTPSDERFRQLFTATPGQILVGADLAGIELRMLSHYLHRYDEGRYAHILLTGDIHQTNADKIGISRKLVKTVTYAFLYGAGDIKIGLSYDKQLPPSQAKAKGKEIRKAYIEAIPGLADLLAAVQTAADRGYVNAIDGRRLNVDSPHKALNFLLQGSSASLAKKWLVIANDTVKETNLCASQLAFVHDELQYECHPPQADELKFALELSATLAGEFYNIRCPIAAEGKIGVNWAEVH
jgi:DNA polymerase I-like protein with 3'-5' exonuclease and polymerase domains